MILFIIFITFDYIQNISNPKVKKFYGPISSQDLVLSGEYEHFRNIRFAPFNINTKQEVYIEPISMKDHSFKIDYKIIYSSDKNQKILLHTFLEKEKVIGIPKIMYNNQKLVLIDVNKSRREKIISSDAGEVNKYYEFESFNISGKNKVDVLEVKGLKLYREPHKLTKIDKPLFFNDNYYVTYTLPTNIPVIISENKVSDEWVYHLKLPPFKKIEKKSSGWLNATFSATNKPLFSGLINQEIIENGKDVTFKTRISLQNLPYSFDYSFIPSWEIFFVILLFFWFPLIFFLINKINKSFFKNKNLIYRPYLLILGLLGIGSLTNYRYILILINELYRLINIPYLIFIILFPCIFYIVFKNR